MKEEKKKLVPNWLKELQQRSWEPEILLSGIVLYGMFKVPEILDDFLAFFKLNIFGGSQDIDNLVALSKMGIYWLIGGLILHLICRGIWIGMVGLSYTFPKGIRKNKLSYKGKFKYKISKTPNYEEIVIRLEKISSSLFSISFMLFMSLIGGYLFFLILIIIPFTITYIYLDIGFDDVFFDYFQVYVLIILSIGIMGLLDFISLGFFRRFKWFAKIYWPLHKVISLLTLSRFYRPIYYGFVTNFNKWAFFLLLFVFTFVSILGAGGIANNSYPSESFSRLSLWESKVGYSAFEGYYDNQNQDNPSQYAQIQSDVINGDVVKLFLVANILYEESMLKYTSLDSLKEVYPDTASSAIKLMVLDIYTQVAIDDDTIDIERWYQYYKVSTKQRGYLAYIPIGTLSEGMHHLKVLGPTKRFRTLAEIPFYRDVPFDYHLPFQGDDLDTDGERFQAKPLGVRENK